MPRGKPASGITIGFIGTGVMDPDTAIDLIEEYINETINADEPAKFIFPLTETEFTDTLDKLAEMARKSRIAYEVITNPEAKKRRAFTQVAAGASKQYLLTDVFTQMETILTEAPKSILFVLWDDKRDAELQSVCAKFLDAEIEIRDLTNALAPLGVPYNEGEEGEEPGDEPATVEEDDEDEDGGEEEDAQEVRELEAEAVSVFTRAALEKMNHADVKEIAVNMGLAPRKARENMIVAILDAQGGPQDTTVVSVEPEAPAQVGTGAEFLEGLQDILDVFGSRFMSGLDDWLTKFSTAAEGFAFNANPEEPMDVDEPEPVRRPRLVRPPR